MIIEQRSQAHQFLARLFILNQQFTNAFENKIKIKSRYATYVMAAGLSSLCNGAAITRQILDGFVRRSDACRIFFFFEVSDFFHFFLYFFYN